MTSSKHLAAPIVLSTSPASWARSTKRATSVKTCWHCREEHDDKFNTCDDCRKRVRKRMANLRAERRAAGLCTRCGRRKPVKGIDTCRACRKENKEIMARVYERRIAAGMCTRCGERPPEPGLSGCCVCLEREAFKARTAKRWLQGDPTLSQRVNAYRARQRALGNCVVCGIKTEVNPKTGYAFAKCDYHRSLDARRTPRRRIGSSRP